MRERHRPPACIVASALGLAGALLCLLGFMRPVSAEDVRTLQVWPDRSVGVSTGLLAGPAPYTATQVFPMGVSNASGGDVVRARTYLHFPLDVFPPGTEIIRATLHVYVDSGSGTEDAKLGAYRVLAPWEEGDLGQEPSAWPRLLDTPLAVTVARLDDVSLLRSVLPASAPDLAATATVAATPVKETSRSLSRPAGHARMDQGSSVTLDPQSSEVEAGDTRTVDVRVENVENLYDVGLYITFDPALLEVVDATPDVDTDPDTEGVQIEIGTFLGAGEVGINDVDNDDGVIDFSYWPDDAVDGSGTLATITFRGKAAGESAIAISDEDSYLLDDNDDIIDADFTGGSMTVTGEASESTDTPTPSATPTSSASPLETPEPTATPSPGPSPTATPTPSATPTSSASPLPTPTPTLTPSPTPGVPAATAVLALGEVEGTWLTWDVSALVRAWLAWEVAGYGVAVGPGPAPDAGPDTAGDLLVARWFTADDPRTRPYIIAEFRVHPTTPTPTAAYGPVLPPAGGSGGVWGLGVLLIGAAFVMLGLLRRKM